MVQLIDIEQPRFSLRVPAVLRRTKQRILSTCLRASTSILLTLLLLEVALRLFPSLIPPPVLVGFNKELRGKVANRLNLPTRGDAVFLDRDDGGPPLSIYTPGRRITLRFNDPGTVQTVVMDEIGFCNPPEDYYNKEQINVVSIGDSFTFCLSVDPHDTWTSRIGSLTHKSVYNLGSPGQGVYEYLQILKHFGLQKAPQTVVLAVYEGNDLRDAVYYARYNYDEATKASGGKENQLTVHLTSHYSDIAYRTIKDGWIGRKSYILNFAASSMALAQDWIKRKIIRASSSNDEEQLGVDFQYTIHEGGSPAITFNSEGSDLDEPRYADRLRHGEISLELFTPALKDFVALSKKYHFKPIVIYIPSAYTAYGHSVRFHDARLGNLLPWFSASQRGFFADKAKELGFVFCDMTNPLQESALNYMVPEKLLYYPTNLHLTKYGHEVIAESLLTLINNLSLPVPATRKEKAKSVSVATKTHPLSATCNN